MDRIEAALSDLRLLDKPNISETARKFKSSVVGFQGVEWQTEHQAAAV